MAVVVICLVAGHRISQPTTRVSILADACYNTLAKPLPEGVPE